MRILGVSFDYHDAAAALLIDGDIIAADTEERFTRIKHDPSLPASAIQFCLDEAGISVDALDKVIFYENTSTKFDRILRETSREKSQKSQTFDHVLQSWVSKDKFFPQKRLADHLGIPQSKVQAVNHHLAHAASAYFASGFEEAVIVTLDGVGEYETASVNVGKDGSIKKLYSQNIPDSIGLFYSAFTSHLGFEVNEGEYKVMGMAGFGEPKHFDTIMKMFDLSSSNDFKLDQRFFDFSPSSQQPYTDKLVDLFGPPRERESTFDVNDRGEIGETSRHFANIAASVQKATEHVILDYVSKAIKSTGLTKVCMAGGVALNSLANRRLERELGIDLFIQPAAGDAGGALGAAYLGEVPHVLKKPKVAHTALYGKQVCITDIEKNIRQSLKRRSTKYDDMHDLTKAVADLIAGGKVVGWYQGRAEWGPRALGCRSILANPADPDMKDRVNTMVKFREPFRPFAPSVLTEVAHTYFEVEPIVSASHPENFMLSIAPVREDYQEKLPAITHIDGTARLQRVSKTSNPQYYDLISAVGERTGIPMVLNTSFNLRGEPIVGAPEDAISTFAFSNLDALALGPYLITKD